MASGYKRVKCGAQHPYHLSVRCEKTPGHRDGHRFMSWDAKRVIQWGNR